MGHFLPLKLLLLVNFLCNFVTKETHATALGLPPSLIGPNLTPENYVSFLLWRDCQKLKCTGLDCALITDRKGCQVCECPTTTPARGCDRMPDRLYNDLFENGCLNISANGVVTNQSAQKVIRWYRKIVPEKAIDECVSYEFPYCEGLDHRLWRSPETKEECQKYCFSTPSPKFLQELKLLIAQFSGAGDLSKQQKGTTLSPEDAAFISASGGFESPEEEFQKLENKPNNEGFAVERRPEVASLNALTNKTQILDPLIPLQNPEQFGSTVFPLEKRSISTKAPGDGKPITAAPFTFRFVGGDKGHSVGPSSKAVASNRSSSTISPAKIGSAGAASKRPIGTGIEFSEELSVSAKPAAASIAKSVVPGKLNATTTMKSVAPHRVNTTIPAELLASIAVPGENLDEYFAASGEKQEPSLSSEVNLKEGQVRPEVASESPNQTEEQPKSLINSSAPSVAVSHRVSVPPKIAENASLAHYTVAPELLHNNASRKTATIGSSVNRLPLANHSNSAPNATTPEPLLLQTIPLPEEFISAKENNTVSPSLVAESSSEVLPEEEQSISGVSSEGRNTSISALSSKSDANVPTVPESGSEISAGRKVSAQKQANLELEPQEAAEPSALVPEEIEALEELSINGSAIVSATNSSSPPERYEADGRAVTQTQKRIIFESTVSPDKRSISTASPDKNQRLPTTQLPPSKLSSVSTLVNGTRSEVEFGEQEAAGAIVLPGDEPNSEASFERLIHTDGNNGSASLSSTSEAVPSTDASFEQLIHSGDSAPVAAKNSSAAAVALKTASSSSALQHSDASFERLLHGGGSSPHNGSVSSLSFAIPRPAVSAALQHSDASFERILHGGDSPQNVSTPVSSTPSPVAAVSALQHSDASFERILHGGDSPPLNGSSPKPKIPSASPPSSSRQPTLSVNAAVDTEEINNSLNQSLSVDPFDGGQPTLELSSEVDGQIIRQGGPDEVNPDSLPPEMRSLIAGVATKILTTTARPSLLPAAANNASAGVAADRQRSSSTPIAAPNSGTVSPAVKAAVSGTLLHAASLKPVAVPELEHRPNSSLPLMTAAAAPEQDESLFNENNNVSVSALPAIGAMQQQAAREEDALMESGNLPHNPSQQNVPILDEQELQSAAGKQQLQQHQPVRQQLVATGNGPVAMVNGTFQQQQQHVVAIQESQPFAANNVAVDQSVPQAAAGVAEADGLIRATNQNQHLNQDLALGNGSSVGHIAAQTQQRGATKVSQDSAPQGNSSIIVAENRAPQRPGQSRVSPLPITVEEQDFVEDDRDASQIGPNLGIAAPELFIPAGTNSSSSIVSSFPEEGDDLLFVNNQPANAGEFPDFQGKFELTQFISSNASSGGAPRLPQTSSLSSERDLEETVLGADRFQVDAISTVPISDNSSISAFGANAQRNIIPPRSQSSSAVIEAAHENIPGAEVARPSKTLSVASKSTPHQQANNEPEDVEGIRQPLSIPPEVGVPVKLVIDTSSAALQHGSGKSIPISLIEQEDQQFAPEADGHISSSRVQVPLPAAASSIDTSFSSRPVAAVVGISTVTPPVIVAKSSGPSTDEDSVHNGAVETTPKLVIFKTTSPKAAASASIVHSSGSPNISAAKEQQESPTIAAHQNSQPKANATAAAAKTASSNNKLVLASAAPVIVASQPKISTAVGTSSKAVSSTGPAAVAPTEQRHVDPSRIISSEQQQQSELFSNAETVQSRPLEQGTNVGGSVELSSELRSPVDNAAVSDRS